MEAAQASLGFGYCEKEVEGFATVSGTQLREGTIEGRCIRVGGLHWDNELDSAAARDVAKKLLAAADEMD
jgi:hypothetical protein